jgi:hypothetical protein
MVEQSIVTDRSQSKTTPMRRSCLSVFVCLLISVSSAFAQLNNDPDRIETTQGDLVVHPILHGTVIFEWDGKTIYMDPWGSADLYEGRPAPESSSSLTPMVITSVRIRSQPWIPVVPHSMCPKP